MNGYKLSFDHINFSRYCILCYTYVLISLFI